MLIRILFIILAFFNGIGLLIYIILWIILPEKPYNEYVYNMGMSSDAAGTTDNIEAAETKPNNGKLYLGGILIVLGVLFLVEKVVPDFTFFDIFPFIVIFAGIFLILNSLRKKNEQGN